MHDSIVRPFFMEELTDIRDKGKTQVKDNYNSIQDTNVRIDLDCSYTVFPSL